MQKQAGVALGAGLASALLFAVSAKGSTAAALLVYLTAVPVLPVLIAGLAFGLTSGLGSAVIGAAAVALGINPNLGGLFALYFGLPGWWLSYLANLARSVPATNKQTLHWYPVGRLVTWTAALASLSLIVSGGVLVLSFGGYEEATQTLAQQLADAVETPPASLDAAMFAVRMFPPAMASLLFLTLCLNLWLAARIAKVSERLVRPWPNVPDGLRLPMPAAGLFLVALGPSFFGGAVGTVAGVIAAPLGLAFALQGLGAAHVLTRGFRGRGSILALIYIVTFIVPVAVVALCLIGLIDCLFSLRNRQPPIPTPST